MCVCVGGGGGRGDSSLHLRSFSVTVNVYIPPYIPPHPPLGRLIPPCLYQTVSPWQSPQWLPQFPTSPELLSFLLLSLLLHNKVRSTLYA